MLQANRSMHRGEWSMLIVLSVLWGASFFFVELAIAELPPMTVVAVVMVQSGRGTSLYGVNQIGAFDGVRSIPAF